MNILAVETTGALASVAIINEKGQIFEECHGEKQNHLQFLMPMVGKVLEKSQLLIDDVTAIAASEGPGSFTGIRIGVSSVRALAQALNVECVSVPTLKTFLYHMPEYRGLICPIFDARRNQVYGGAYRWKEGANSGNLDGMEELVQGNAYMLEELLALLKSAIGNNSTEVTFMGDGVEVYRAQIQQWQTSSLNDNIQIVFATQEENCQRAASVARFAMELYQRGQTCGYNSLKPNYMRKAEAERRLEEARSNTAGGRSTETEDGGKTT